MTNANTPNNGNNGNQGGNNQADKNKKVPDAAAAGADAVTEDDEASKDE